MADLVSVIMPFKNGHGFVGEALDSIELQEWPNLEVVLVDDNSDTPFSFDTDRYSFETVVLRNTDPKQGGAGFARGLAISHAKGRYIAFLDCDDVWRPGKIKGQISQMNERNLGLSFGGYANFSADREESKAYVPEGPFTWERFLSKDFTIGCLTVIYDREKVCDPRPSTLKRRNDYHLWAQLIANLEHRGANWGGVEQHLGDHRLHKGSLTASKVKAAVGYWRFLGVVEMTPVWRVWHFVNYVRNTIALRFSKG
ncbi:MAG: glycosyltransferase family A protein [Chloroflexota bacterium]